MKNFISVVIPSHFRPDLLNSLLDSLEKQTYPFEKFEVIVVPTPDKETEKVISSRMTTAPFSLRHEPIPDDPSGGKDVSAKRNFGVEKAKGEWIAFIDDDCLAHPDWISEASKNFEDDNIAGIEGLTKIPKIEFQTLTNKGLQRLSRPGGFQTCNIFYRKSNFLTAGGFDARFPWYLEDTDLAWSILGQGKAIHFNEKSIVSHPLKEAATWRLLHEAKGTILKALLFKKHPELYRKYKMQALRFSQKVYLSLNLILLLSLFSANKELIFFSAGLLLLTLIFHLVKQFWGCRFTWHELASTFYYWTITPAISAFQLFRGCLKNKIGFKDSLYLFW